MGLDAIVFRNVRSLEAVFGRGVFDVDEETGEGLLKADARVEVPREAYFAVQKRLGNSTEIEWLREIVTNALCADSFIAQRVLYSGTHSGDVIHVGELPLLRRDLGLLITQDRRELDSFVETIGSLLEHAEAESNPIVFV